LIVENKPGAAKQPGTDFLAKTPPDVHLVIVAWSHATSSSSADLLAR
jgi:hypothetical protein